MPTPERGASGQGSNDLLYRRGRGRRKKTPARFIGASAPQPPPSPPPQEHQHAPQQHQIEENPEPDMDSDGSGTDPEEFDKFVSVSLADLRSNVQCPICLGIIKKARTVMGCLHRFCRECIDKSMRLGNNECPACRTHCASRRSLRDDVVFDTLVNSVYTDVEKYEQEVDSSPLSLDGFGNIQTFFLYPSLHLTPEIKRFGGLSDKSFLVSFRPSFLHLIKSLPLKVLLQELVLYEEEKAANEQIRASIAQSFLRQTEAVAKARKMGRAKGASTSRADRSCLKSYSRRSDQSIKFGDSNKNGDESDTDINALMYENQHCEGISPVRSPRVAVDEEDTEGIQRSTECTRNSSSPANANVLSWGRARIRSHSRRGGANNSKAIRSSNRIEKLAAHLANVERREHEHIPPVITSHVQNDKVVYLKDCELSGSSSSAVEAPMPEPHVIERYRNELAQRISGMRTTYVKLSDDP